MGIGSSPAFGKYHLQPGNVLSNEPGFYQQGSFGIRVEDVMVVVKAKVKNPSGVLFYEFENVTMVPYCRNLLDLSLLNITEREWINTQNKQTREKIQNLLVSDTIALTWLNNQTKPI